MPSIANLSLQNNAAVAVVGTALVPSAGDTVAAQWRVETTKPPFARTGISMMSRFNTKRTARHIDVKISMPITTTNTTTSLEELVATALFSGTLILPTNAPSTATDDLVAYVKTFFADAGVVLALKAGYAPT